MARDLKLANWTFPNIAGSTTAMPVAQSTPSGDATNSQGKIDLKIVGTASASTGAYRAASDPKNIAGFINSKMDTSSFANFIAGNEVTATTTPPYLWGNTSYAEMYARCTVSLSGMETSSNAVFSDSTGGYIVLEGAYENPASTAVAVNWLPISGAVPLTFAVANLAAVAVGASSLFTTQLPHGLVAGDVVVFSDVTGLSNVIAGQLYQVGTVPSTLTFTLVQVGGSALGTAASGTPLATCLVQKTLTGNGGSKIVAMPVVQSVRPWVRFAVHYRTNSSGGAMSVTINRTQLVLGRDNSIAY